MTDNKVDISNKLLNNALRAKGYAGPDIKMVLTDVIALNEPYCTNTFVVGGSLGIINGELIYDSETSELSAFRLVITASAISLIKSFDSNKKEAEKNIFEINNTVLKIKNILERNGKIWK